MIEYFYIWGLGSSPHLQLNGENLGRGYTKIIITSNKSMLLKELRTDCKGVTREK